MTFILSNWMTLNLAEFCNWMTIYCVSFNLAECSIRVTVLLEYINLALNERSWVTHWHLLKFLSTTARAFYDYYHWLGLVSYLRGLFPNSFQTTKRHLRIIASNLVCRFTLFGGISAANSVEFG